MPGVVIIGGGISGLAAAWYLAKGGVSSTIVEARPRLGGLIQTEQVEGCVIEGGPDSFLSVKPAALELIRDVGLGDQVIGSNDHLRKTYVWKDGRLVALPDGLMMMIPTKVLPMLATPLLGWSTKLRMGLDLFRRPGPPAGEQSVADFIAGHYGREAVEYLAEPLLSGIYGGSPENLSAASVLPRFIEMEARYGSLTRGVLAGRRSAHSAGPLFTTLKGGLGQLVDALAAALEPRIRVIHGRAAAVQRTSSGFAVKLQDGTLEAEHLVIACEAHNAAALLGGIHPEAAALLGTVRYSSSMTAALAYEPGDFPRPLDGFGFLVPRRERRRLVACTVVGTKFPFRVPPGLVLLRCFLGGMDDPAVLAESDDAVLEMVRDELRRITGVTAPPRFSRISRWPLSMAQYTVGHGGRIAQLEARVNTIAGLHVAGNAYQGIGIPDCIRTGRSAAEAILATGRAPTTRTETPGSVPPA